MSPTLMGDSLPWNHQGRLLLIFLFKYFRILKVFIRISYKIHFKCKVFTSQWKGIFIFIFCLSMHYFQVFYYLVWVVRILRILTLPSHHYCITSCFVALFQLPPFNLQFIQSYRPTIKNRIFHKVYDSPSYGSV